MAEQPNTQDQDLLLQVAAILAVGASTQASAEALTKVTGLPVELLLAILGGVKKLGEGEVIALDDPVIRLESGRSALDITRDAARMYRAAFVLNATRRAKDRRAMGATILQAVTPEYQSWKLHVQAQARRYEMAKRIDVQAVMHGPQLGWYAVVDGRTTLDCLAANGHNFEIHKPPRIGYPGTVHARCRCVPGSPHIGAKTVDQAVRARNASFERRSR